MLINQDLVLCGAACTLVPYLPQHVRGGARAALHGRTGAWVCRLPCWHGRGTCQALVRAPAGAHVPPMDAGPRAAGADGV